MIPIPNLNVILTSVAILVAGATGWSMNGWKLNAKIDRMTLEHNQALQEALVKTLEIERQNQQLANDIEVQSAKHRKELQNVESEFHILVDNAGGLFDPNASDCAAGTQPTTTTAKPAAPSTRGNISKNLERLLLSEAKRADEAAAYARTCYNWLMELQHDGRFRPSK